MNNPYQEYGVSDDVARVASLVAGQIAPAISEVERIRGINQLRVLRAFQNARISDIHFGYPTGYGYDDIGREKIEEAYAEIFGGQAAYVRIQISSGTQAIAACLSGILRPGDHLLSVTGKPYDTLATVIGPSAGGGKAVSGNLGEFGITFSCVELQDDGSPDLCSISESVTENTKLVMIQKSRGYSQRRSLFSSDITDIVSAVRAKNPQTIILADNCYGEFVEEKEPCHCGVDLCAGSLIKNPGGGICPSGGYIVGREDLVEMVASRLSAPGLGSHVGPSLGFNRTIAQGLFLAPHVVAESLKGAIFAAALFEASGFETAPGPLEKRGDIVQSICFKSPEQVMAFCEVIQKCSPVDSFVRPEPWDMPGYDGKVIMAAGTFVQGSSIELSADGPMKPPYIAYMQGGLVSEQTMLAAMLAVGQMGVITK